MRSSPAKTTRLVPAALALLALSCNTPGHAELRSRIAMLEEENVALRIENMRLQANYEELLARQRPDPLAMIPSKYQTARALVYFGSESAKVPAKYLSDIKSLAGVLIENPELYLTLEGYADPRGLPDLNNQLAEDRALAVAELVESSGVESYRIRVEVIGATVRPPESLSESKLQQDRKVIAVIHSSAH